jgi:hypothetical protein
MTAALAGGAIGALITLVVALLVRLASVPREVARNDRLAHDRDDDLRRWVVDRSYEIEEQLVAIRSHLAAHGMARSGDYGFRIRSAKGTALHQYRDQEIESRRLLASTYDGENWLHDWWRKARRLPRHELATPVAAKPVLAVWRLPADPGADHGAGRELLDPTERSLPHLVQRLTANPGPYQ